MTLEIIKQFHDAWRGVPSRHPLVRQVPQRTTATRRLQTATATQLGLKFTATGADAHFQPPQRCANAQPRTCMRDVPGSFATMRAVCPPPGLVAFTLLVGSANHARISSTFPRPTETNHQSMDGEGTVAGTLSMDASLASMPLIIKFVESHGAPNMVPHLKFQLMLMEVGEGWVTQQRGQLSQGTTQLRGQLS
jgi:hypothetical protein